MGRGGEGRWDDGGGGGGPGIDKNLKMSLFDVFKSQHVEQKLEKCILTDVFEQAHESRNGNHKKSKFQLFYRGTPQVLTSCFDLAFNSWNIPLQSAG